MSTTVTKYPGIITQNSGKNIRQFKDLNNLKNNSNSVAVTNGRIQGKNKTVNKPAKITCTNFGFNIPKGAEIKKIVVNYSHQKLEYTSKKIPNIQAPIFKLLNTGLSFASDTREYKGTTPTTTMPKNLSRTWDGKGTKFTKVATGITISNGIISGKGDLITTDAKGNVISKQSSNSGATKEINQYINKQTAYNYDLPTWDKINSNAFGISFDYPANANNYEGWLRLKFISISITYDVTKYSFNVKSTAKNIISTIVNAEITITNVNNTRYKPKLTLTLPENATLVRSWGHGTLKKNSNGTYDWSSGVQNPGAKAGYSTGLSATLYLELQFNTLGSSTLDIVEDLNNTHGEFAYETVAVTSNFLEEMGVIDPVADDGAMIGEIIYTPVNTDVEFCIKLPENYPNETVKLYSDGDVDVKISNTMYDGISLINPHEIPYSEFLENKCTIILKANETGVINLYLDEQSNSYATLKVIPQNLGNPAISVLKLTKSELNYMGDSYNYTVSSKIKVEVSNENLQYFHNYYRNFRIGVYNGPVPNDNSLPMYVFEKCTNWSTVITKFNEYEEKSVDFVYDKEYPVFIIVTGEFIGANPDKLLMYHTHPIIYESDEDFTDSCLLPTELPSILSVDDDCEVILPYLQSSNPFCFYNFEINEDFETGPSMAVKGIEYSCVLSCNEKIVVIATLRSPTGEYGSRSFFLEPGDEQIITIGGDFDLWGFNISDMVNLSQFELILQVSNSSITTNSPVEIKINTSSLTFYYINIEDELVTVKVNGEDLRWYKAFLQDTDAVPGFNSDVQYLKVDGTDKNEAVRQTIKEKEFILQFYIDGCNIYETTQLLKQLTALMTNNRESLKPTPNILEISTYPGEYWEFIIESVPDIDVEAANLEVKYKIIIPHGTSYSNNDTVTGAIGVVNGITKVNPRIVLNNIHSGTIEILEENSNQKFMINYPFTDADYVIIDCLNRRIYLADENGLDSDDDLLDITENYDYNSDWFILGGQYSFVSEDCHIDSVTYNERG